MKMEKHILIFMVLLPVLNAQEQECEWLPWINNDGPSWTCDCEQYSDDDCEVEKYEVSLASGGPVYSDVSSVPNNKLVFNSSIPRISCINKDQENCQVAANGHMFGPSPPCCLDYKIRFCCKKTSGQGVVSEIITKTGNKYYDATVDNVSATLCNQDGDCCSTLLDNPDDLQLGSLDTYTGPAQLGDCFDFDIGGGEISATVEITEKENSDGWFVEWLMIKLSGGKEYICYYNGFIKNGDGVHPRKRTVECKKLDLTGCADGWERFGDKCYQQFSRTLRWKDAESFCQNEGGHLASVHSEEQNDFLFTISDYYNGFATWLGGHFDETEGKWTWSDGSPWDFSPAGFPCPSCPPTGDTQGPCTTFWHSASWNYATCSAGFWATKFVCQIDLADQLFPDHAVLSSTHQCSIPETCGPASYCIDSDLETFCHTAHDIVYDTFPWVALKFPTPVLVTRVEIEGYALIRVGTVEVRITDTMPGDGNTNYWGQQTGGELFGTFTGSDAETLVSLRNNPTKGTVVIVQRDQGKHPNNVILMNEIRVFGTKVTTEGTTTRPPLETCEGDCCWQGPSRYIIESKGPSDGIRSWPEKYDNVVACAKRCEDLSDCKAFHYYGPGDEAYKDCYLQKGGVIGPQLSDGKKRFAGVCEKKEPTEGPGPVIYPLCCKSKRVGEIDYTLVENSTSEVPEECKSKCIYEKVGYPGSQYCFAPGPLPVECFGNRCHFNHYFNIFNNLTASDSISGEVSFGKSPFCGSLSYKNIQPGKEYTHCIGRCFVRKVTAASINAEGDLITCTPATAGSSFQVVGEYDYIMASPVLISCSVKKIN